jgi:hypothetical protein
MGVKIKEHFQGELGLGKILGLTGKIVSKYLFQFVKVLYKSVLFVTVDKFIKYRHYW